ncbi:hypothetical protein AAE02nite_37940 [Adhaeribacter aerolatus]|uniref:Outer membrane protein beta-barrel domain-containing protein n=1 Tax=Adhaeribacter aerolatus TaxID=670289 RepID=A0A512B2G2_9BACT|nr:hypothetical protein [Adhaeribacter aerolatus]GEO06130.1 hypothetical protein AAE02nite_37940 [Adhaeribacter aerolatus]
MQKCLLLLLIIVIPVVSFAQANYKSGIVITLQGDTLKGYINYKEWINNPKEVDYKPSLTESAQTFTPKNIKSFAIAGLESYEAFEVSVSMDNLNANGIREIEDTLNVTNSFFLKALLKGDKVHVYSYKDKIKERYYFLENDNTNPVELRNQVFLTTSNVVTPVFKQQLSALAIKYKNFPLSQQIASLAYNKTDLLNTLKQLNTVNAAVVAYNREKKPKARFFLGTGLAYNTITYSGENLFTIDRKNANGFDKYKDKVISQSYQPRFAGGIDIFINPEVKRTILRGEILVTPLQSEVVSYLQYNSVSDREQRNTYNLSMVIVSAMPQVIYNLYNKENFQFYLGTGAAYSYYRTNQNILNRIPTDDPDNPDAIIEDYVIIKKRGLNVVLRSGIVLKKKIDLGIVYFNPTEITNYTSAKGSSVKANNLQLSLNYLFN